MNILVYTYLFLLFIVGLQLISQYEHMPLKARPLQLVLALTYNVITEKSWVNDT